MQDLAFLRHVTIGQYVSGESPVHRLDPRTKITLALLLVAAMTVNTSYMANVLMLALCLAAVRASRLSLGYVVGGLRPAVPVLAFLAIFQLLFLGNAPVTTSLPRVTLLEWGPVAITTYGIQLVIVLLLRLVSLTILTSVLTNTTTMSDLTHGLEDMLRPFARLGLPAHELSLIGTISLRFIPILAEELETIMKAQASRGADLGTGSRLKFLQTTRAMLVMIVPLFLNAFRRAEDLIVAMEARCYSGGRGRTRLVQLHLRPVDGVMLAAIGALSAGLLAFGPRFPF